jgi:hypothetical protein
MTTFRQEKPMSKTTVLGPDGQPVKSSRQPDFDGAAKSTIGEISTGYYLIWWCMTHPKKLILYSVGGVGAIATLIVLINFGISLAVGDGPSVIRPLRSADVGEWGDKAGRSTREFLNERRRPAESAPGAE